MKDYYKAFLGLIVLPFVVALWTISAVTRRLYVAVIDGWKGEDIF